nr:SMP-30/gluconolactonase/LRE family protein [Eilatimonas milleporae]
MTQKILRTIAALQEVKEKRPGRKLMVAGAILLLSAAFLLWPGRLDPLAWAPPDDPGFTGDFAVNTALGRAEVIALDTGHGPEDVAVDGQGRLYGGLADGRIVRILPDGRQEIFAVIAGGRPLGLHFDGRGQLIVADAYRGLLSISPAGTVTVLSTEADGIPFRFTDDVDVARDGRIYFTDASWRYSQPDYRLDIMSGRGYGRLLVHDPAVGTTATLLDNLYFANGVALSAAEDFILINETGRYRVRRLWLKGARSGQDEVFIDNLPGFPDGISHGEGSGLFWLALASPRSALLDRVHPYPWLKRLIAKLPKSIQPSARPHGHVVALREDGRVAASLQAPDGRPVTFITSVEEAGGTLHFGSLEAPQIGRMAVPEALLPR